MADVLRGAKNLRVTTSFGAGDALAYTAAFFGGRAVSSVSWRVRLRTSGNFPSRLVDPLRLFVTYYGLLICSP
jgi:hypothetical protein